jgi:hypothetical protein
MRPWPDEHILRCTETGCVRSRLYRAVRSLAPLHRVSLPQARGAPAAKMHCAEPDVSCRPQDGVVTLVSHLTPNLWVEIENEKDRLSWSPVTESNRRPSPHHACRFRPMGSRWVGLPQVRAIPVSVYIAPRRLTPEAVVTWFGTGHRDSGHGTGFGCDRHQFVCIERDTG